MSEHLLQQLNDTEKAAKEDLELASSLNRLLSNPDFEKLILKGYLETHAINMVSSMTENFRPGGKESLIEEMHGFGALRRYLDVVNAKAANAEKTLIDVEETRESIEKGEFGDSGF